MPLEECLNAYDGTSRHEDVTYAAYKIVRADAECASSWCADCLMQYIECRMLDCIVSVRLIDPVRVPKRHAEVVKALDEIDVSVYR